MILGNTPAFTATENNERLSREMRECLDRLAMFEKRLQDEYVNMMGALTHDNNNFKATYAESHRAFVEDVRKEVAKLERGFDLVEAAHTESLNGVKEDFRDQCAKVIECINSRVEAYSQTLADAFADYQRRMTKEVNLFEGDVNNALKLHHDSVTEILATFKNDFREIVTNKYTALFQKVDESVPLRINVDLSTGYLVFSLATEPEMASGDVITRAYHAIEHGTPVEYAVVLENDMLLLRSCGYQLFEHGVYATLMMFTDSSLITGTLTHRIPDSVLRLEIRDAGSFAIQDEMEFTEAEG